MAYTTIVSTEVLASHLENGWAIIDCRSDLQDHDWGLTQYRAGHVPGAVYADLLHDLSGPVAGTNGRHPLPADANMAATFGRFGIAPGTQVVVYDQDSGMYASRLWWMLRYLGHDAVAVLDGGWSAWTREGRPVHSGDETRAAATFIASSRPEWRLDLAAAQAQYRDPAVLFVDARATERYEGTVEPLDRIAGHIPGARNHFFKNNLSADGTMLPPDVLRQQWTEALGTYSPEQTVMYCGSGVTACHNLLAMAHAGLPGARLYAGSWSEWSAAPDAPVEKGKREGE